MVTILTIPKTIFHGMTVFVLWHDNFCHAMENTDAVKKGGNREIAALCDVV